MWYTIYIRLRQTNTKKKEVFTMLEIKKEVLKDKEVTKEWMLTKKSRESVSLDDIEKAAESMTGTYDTLNGLLKTLKRNIKITAHESMIRACVADLANTKVGEGFTRRELEKAIDRYYDDNPFKAPCGIASEVLKQLIANYGFRKVKKLSEVEVKKNDCTAPTPKDYYLRVE